MADFTIAMTPEQFIAAGHVLATSPDILHSTETSPTSGVVYEKQLDFTYEYDGKAEMAITIDARHSFAARLASIGQIQDRMQAMLLALPTG